MFDILFLLVPVFIGFVFIFTFLMMFSPKLRGKMMSKQIKSLKYMMDDSKDDLTDIATTSGDVMVNASKKIIDNNEDDLKDLVTKSANISKEGIETTVRAIRKGITEDEMYCKHCGTSIDKDSKYCKKCGKEQ